MTLDLHPETCVGTGMCTFYAPNTFDLGDDGRVRLFTPAETGGADTDEELANAAEACPTRSIRLG